MTSVEFSEVRKRLDLASSDFAATYGLSPAEVVAIEQGRKPVPKRVARDLKWQAALLERREIVARSGLPECVAAPNLEQKAEGLEGDDLLRALEALNAHANNCEICRAREQYLEEHAPPLPDAPLPFWVRLIGRVTYAIERMPPGIRPPEGEAGEGRRIGIGMAVLFSLFALVLVGLGIVGTIINGNGIGAEGWGKALAFGLIPVGYLVGFYTGGLVFDLTRPIRHRLIGYIIRGAFGAAAVIGAVGLITPLLDEDIRWADLPILTAAFGVIGCLLGAGLWVKHRATGKITPPA